MKLSDFGIARAQADASLTQTGLVTGSPAYLAPEVAQGRIATGASDSWALGASLFHALSGRPPYDVGENLLGALYRIVHEQPPRCAEAGWLATLLDHTMTHDPAQRWDMAQIKAFLDAGPAATVERPVARRRARRTAPAPAATEGTQVLAPASPGPPPGPPGPRPTGPPSAGAPPATPLMSEPVSAPGHRRPRTRLLAALGALVLLAAVTFGAVRLGSDGGGADDPQAAATPSPTASPSAAASESPAAPTAEGMDAFIADYLTVAADDPANGFDLLTPAYQRASKGIEGYRGFWDGVSAVDLDPGSVESDPATGIVTYTYTYTYEGREQTETVTLQLEYDEADGSYLIAGDV